MNTHQDYPFGKATLYSKLFRLIA